MKNQPEFTLAIRDTRGRDTRECERRLQHLMRYSLGVFGFSVIAVEKGNRLDTTTTEGNAK